MKAVGVISRGYETLHLHIPFLVEQCRTVLQDSFSYDALEGYLRTQRQLRNPSHDDLLTSEVPDLEVTTPLGHFSQFVKFYRASVFALWRLVLLQTRMLFYSPPPLEVSCYRVYSACLLGSHHIPTAFTVHQEPLFFVEVNDIDLMSTMPKFVACTSEKIFETKKTIYDVFIDRQAIQPNQKYGLIARVHSGDRAKWAELEASMAANPGEKGESVAKA